MNSNKKIAIVLPNLTVIGAQRVAIDYGTRLAQHGYTVDWVCGGSGSWESELDSSKIHFFQAKLFSKIRGIRIIEQIVRLGVIIYSNKYDTILSLTPFYNRILCLFKKTNTLKSRLVIEDHAYPPRSYPDEFSNRLVRFLYVNTERLYDEADIIRTLTKDSKKYYDEKKKNNNIVAYPNLMDISRVDKLSIAHDGNENTPVIDLVYIGRFTTQKNIVFLLECASELIKRIPFKLTIIGYGPQENLLHDKTLELHLENVVSFVESSEKNYSILRRATIFPFVSIWEGFPLVLIEAMIVGAAVVSVDCRTGPRELLGENSERGWLVPENNREAFVNALEEAISNKAMRMQKTSAARQYVINNLNIETKFNEYIDIFISGKKRIN